MYCLVIYMIYMIWYELYVFDFRWIAPELIITTCIIAPEALCWHKRKWNQDFDSISKLIVRLLLWMISFESRRIWRIWESHHSLQYWGGVDALELDARILKKCNKLAAAGDSQYFSWENMIHWFCKHLFWRENAFTNL